MRAALRPTQARNLRAALVRGGRILDERVLGPNEDLTVGPSEHAVFVVSGLPSTFVLVERKRGGATLLLRKGMRGRLADGGRAADLDPANREPIVSLGHDARGRVTIGDCVVLFHLVEAPAPIARTQLPLAVRRRAFDGLDWRTTCIAAFSFLFHFGAVGTAYADFTDATIDDDGARVAQAISVLRALPSPPPLEGLPVPNDGAPMKDSATSNAPKTTAARPPPAGGSGPAHPPQGARMDNARARGIADALREQGSAMLAGIGGKSTSDTGRVLEAGNVPVGMLDDLARSAGGAHPGGPGALALGTTTGAVRPGAIGDRGLAGVADVKREGHGDEAGATTGPRKPIAVANIGGPDVAVGRIVDASRTVASLRGLLRACYRHELDVDPTARGTIRVTATIGTNGEVRSAQVANGGLSSAMGSCVTRVVRGALFSPPEGGSAIVALPMTFIPQ